MDGCDNPCIGRMIICETCRGNICAKTRDKDQAQVQTDLKAQDRKYTKYMARNAIARDYGPRSYMEQLTTRRKLRRQQEQQRHGQRTKRSRAGS
jgi:hypothetical protein